MEVKMHQTGSIVWDQRAVVSIGDGTKIIKDFDIGAYEVRTIKGDDDPFAPETGKLETPVWMSTELDLLDDNLIRVIGKVNIPDVTGLPDGNEGDMLYYKDDTDGWVPFDPPGAPDTDEVNILSHSSTTPKWFTVETMVVTICENGTPVEKSIITLPVPIVIP
jgi:hypothetical protein